MTALFHFLHGKNPHPFDVVCVYLFGIGSGLLVLYIRQPLHLIDWFIAVLTADTVGGIISNATDSTRQQWREQSKQLRWGFLFLHLVVYPVVVCWLLGITDPLGFSLIVCLVGKVLLFGAGQWNTAKDRR